MSKNKKSDAKISAWNPTKTNTPSSGDTINRGKEEKHSTPSPREEEGIKKVNPPKSKKKGESKMDEEIRRELDSIRESNRETREIMKEFLNAKKQETQQSQMEKIASDITQKAVGSIAEQVQNQIGSLNQKLESLGKNLKVVNDMICDETGKCIIPTKEELSQFKKETGKTIADQIENHLNKFKETKGKEETTSTEQEKKHTPRRISHADAVKAVANCDECLKLVGKEETIRKAITATLTEDELKSTFDSMKPEDQHTFLATLLTKDEKKGEEIADFLCTSESCKIWRDSAKEKGYIVEKARKGLL